MRIGLFVTCLVDNLFPDVGRATVAVLERLGHEVVVPRQQTCCGQMHINSGYANEAVALVRNHTEAFLDADCEVIVAPSGSCVGSVRHQGAAIARRAGDEALGRGAEDVAERTYELSELLVDVLGVVDVGARFEHRVTYHPTCHSARLLRVGDRPLELLRHVRGLELVDLPRADSCCGFGGTFAVKNPEVSAAMLADKVDDIGSTGAQFCVASDSSCLMQIAGGLRRRHGAMTHTLHLAEVLASR